MVVNGRWDRLFGLDSSNDANRKHQTTKVTSWLLYVVGVALLMLTLGGCQNAPPTPPSLPPPSSTVLVSYHRSGGIVGYEDQLTIYDDGRSELQRKLTKLEFTLPPNDVARLKELFQKADFFSLGDKYLAPQPVADSIQYTITYQLGEKKHTVRTETLAVPDATQPVLEALNELITSNTK